MQFQTHNDNASINEHANGTSYQGEVQANYQELNSLFGKPTDGDGYKVDAEWFVMFEDGTFATIYNYKNGINYCGKEDGLPVEQIESWHVGGTSVASVRQVQIALDLHREQSSAAEQTKFDEAMSSALDMMESIRNNRGSDYACLVETAMLVRKNQELLKAMIGAAIAGGALPKDAARPIATLHSQMAARMLTLTCRVSKVEGCESAEFGKELMDWADRIMDAEQKGAAELFKSAMEGEDE